jgi:kinesin family protein C2/C3
LILQAKFNEEIHRRKKLHNILEDMKGKIRVFCRIRPMSEPEN